MSMGAVPVSPIRILVRGSSTVSWIASVEPGSVSHAYPRVLETALHLHGWPTQIRAESPLAASSRHILRDADADIFAWDPDVIILNTGHMENLHMLLPIPFARHVFTRTARPGRWRQLYRRRVLWLVYSIATRIQARLEPALGSWIFGRRRNAVIAHVNQYIDIAGRNGHPLVIVMGFVPPSTPPPSFPGVAARLEMMNDAYRDLVQQRAQSEVIWFDPAQALEPHGPAAEVAIGDGIHFTPSAHVAVGKGLAEVVEAWLRTQLEQEHDVVHPENRPRGVVNE